MAHWLPGSQWTLGHGVCRIRGCPWQWEVAELRGGGLEMIERAGRNCILQR